MELLLNIFATVTILALVAIWRAHWARQRRCGVRNSARECMAVCCMAILIFFAISMTDDLQGDLTVTEEISLKRPSSVVVSGGKLSHHEKIKIQPASMAILTNAIALTVPSLISRIAPTEDSPTHFLRLNLLSTRAPPLSA